MKPSFIMFTLAFGLFAAQSTLANPLSEAKAYCESMAGGGLTEEEANQLMNDCMDEQRQYISEQETEFEQEDDSQEQEPQEVDCYEEAESRATENEYGESNYDDLLQACFDRLN